jgi:TRAP-type C4-dicarboxylate transport system substrate-binding protein
MGTATWDRMNDEQKGWYNEALAKADEFNSASCASINEDAKQKSIAELNVEFVEFDREAFREAAAQTVLGFDGELYSAGLFDYIQELTY